MVLGLAPRDRDTDKLYTFAAFVKDGNSAREIERLFQQDTLVDTYVAQGDIRAAIAWLQKLERPPQRLLVDISGSERPLDELDHLADACEPSVQVYVVGERNDVGLFRNLLSRGVQDYLVKPLSIELLRRTTLQESGHLSSQRGRHGRVVVVQGTRGGVGTTTLAANLARALARGGLRRRVVYLDLNVYDGSGPALLGRAGGMALLEVLGNIERLDQQYLTRTLADAGDGLFVLAAELEYTENFRPEAGVMGKLLHALAQNFHYVVVDLPERGGSLAEEIIDHASMVCLVCDPSVHSARTLVRLSQTIRARPSAPSLRNVLNHVQPATRSHVQVNDFAAAVDLPIQVEIAFDAKAPALAENAATDLSGRSEFFKGVEALAAQITGEAHHQTKRSWWQRLTRRGAA